MNKTTGNAPSSSALYKRAFSEYKDKLYSTSTVFQYMQFKFQAAFMPGGGCFPLFRAAEMAFIEAEAACHTGKEATAQSILNEINKVYDPEYNCTKTGNDLLAEVKLYRRFHLWGEGQNWFDFKRWGDTMERISIAKGGSWHKTFSGTIAPDANYKWTFYIPQKELDYNPKVHN